MEAVICGPVRNPIGRYGGMFASLTAVDLGVAGGRDYPVTVAGRQGEAVIDTDEHPRADTTLETMCIGGGQGLAAVFERVAP